MYRIIADETPARTTADWLEQLRTIDVPCAPVNRIDDLFEDPHLNAVGFFETFDHPSEGKLRAVRTPFNAENCETTPDHPAPRLGEDSERILRAAGIDDARLKALADSGVIAIAEPHG